MQRTLSLRTTIALVIGGIIGSGIFMKPALMISQLGSPWLLLSVWVVAGLITLFGALSNAEVASMFPETGGQYVFFQRMYGDFFAYLYGWAAFAVFNTAGNASIAYIFAEYANYFLQLFRFDATVEQQYYFSIPFIGTFYPLQNFGVKTLTVALLCVLTFLNYRSVEQSGTLQRVLTALKVIAITLIITGLAFSKNGNWTHFNETLSEIPRGWAFVSAYMAAVAGAFWAYDGWNNTTFIAGEIIEPQKNISKSLFIGLLTCILVYLCVNIAYIYMLPIAKMSTSSFVASDAAQMAWGSFGGLLITFLVAFSTLGTANANVMATARITFALGQGNRYFSTLGKEHPRFHTPANALVFNLVWSSILVFSGSFDLLTDMLVFVTWFFYGASGLGLLILRKKYPNETRPYRVFGYPILPIIFISFTAFFLVTTLITDIRDFQQGKVPIVKTILGICIVLLGLVFYRNKKDQ
jgi:APA family basic amino acid/polyamine antiporter